MKTLINKELFHAALAALGKELEKSRKEIHLLVGGAGALVGAYGYGDSTGDIDGIPLKSSLDEIEEEVQRVAQSLSLPTDWLNPYYQTYTIYLPKDYKTRTKNVFRGPSLTVDVLGPEELAIMKLMAGRAKDHSHLLFLKKNFDLDLSLIEERLEELNALYPEVTEKALDLFDDLFGEN